MILLSFVLSTLDCAVVFCLIATSTLAISNTSKDEFDSLQPYMQLVLDIGLRLRKHCRRPLPRCATPYPCAVLVRYLYPVRLWGLFPLSFIWLSSPLLPGWIYIYWLRYCCIFFDANIQYSISFYASPFREQFWSRFIPPCLSLCSSCLQVIICFQWFFFLAIPKTCISVLRLRDTIRYGVPNQLVLHGISTIVILVSLHLLLHLVDFNCLVRSRFAERETWLDSSHWGSPCSCE